MHSKHEKWAEHVIKGYIWARDNHVEVVEGLRHAHKVWDCYIFYIYTPPRNLTSVLVKDSDPSMPGLGKEYVGKTKIMFVFYLILNRTLILYNIKY